MLITINYFIIALYIYQIRLPDDLVISIDDKGINKLVKSYLGEQRFQSLESNTGLPEHSLTPPCQKLLDLINNAPPSPVVIRKIIRKSTLGDEIFNFIVHSDLNFAETTITHFPCNPLVHQTLERTAATFTTVTIINNLFFANNDIINLAWFEKEVWTAGNTKWDGVALAVKDKTVAPVLIEFSGGYYKLILYIIDKKIFFEAIYLTKEGTYVKKVHFCVTCPPTCEELKAFAQKIPQMIQWKEAIVS
ncbi:hypothetical protein J3Q64DRAFT_1646138 [Phycomyces blakesleeanus]|uniref:Uncharacterized protein n=1 Tax=Phycomyces blakesleeanus TaxID=4837 RepID=A0ABR3AJW2_PHYBL